MNIYTNITNYILHIIYNYTIILDRRPGTCSLVACPVAACVPQRTALASKLVAATKDACSLMCKRRHPEDVPWCDTPRWSLAVALKRIALSFRLAVIDLA